MSLEGNETFPFPTNGTTDLPHFPKVIKTVSLVVFSIVFIVGVAGNSMVIYIFGRKKQQERTTNEMLLLWLGICDLIYSLIQPPLLIFTVLSFGRPRWYITGCFVTPTVAVIVVTTSQVILIVICYDRYRAIAQPMQPRLCKAMLRAGMCFGIVVSVLLSIPTILQFDNKKFRNEICLDYKNSKYETLIQSLSVFLRDLISLIVMGYFICRMLSALSEREKFRGRTTTAFRKDASSFRRTRRILYAVLIVFTICIVPGDLFFVINSLRYFGKTLSVPEFDEIAVGVLFVKLLQVSNSIANVFIYSAIHPEFKKMNRRIIAQLSKCWRTERVERPFSTLQRRLSRRRLLHSSES